MTGNNCYYNNGNAVPAGDLYSGGTLVNPATEPGAVFANPHLTLSGTQTCWQDWVNYYRPTASSTAIRDTGNSNAGGGTPLPAVIRDIEGNARPQGAGWDIGPYEYPGTPVAPVAAFAANLHGADNPQLWGIPGSTFDFTDCSSGGPTAWSWNFGDTAEFHRAKPLPHLHRPGHLPGDPEGHQLYG